MQIAVTGASGKTGSRVVEEAVARGWEVKAILRPPSNRPERLAGADVVRLELSDRPALSQALKGCDALVIATGARPSPDLFGPLKVDALAIRSQIEACRAAGVPRVLLVSSLCSGRFWHPLNLFGLILTWKGVGERWLADSGLQWTVVRPGGLKESEANLEAEGIRYSLAGQQESGSIPRRLVARVCIEALETPASINRVIEITSGAGLSQQDLDRWLATEA
jgi:uncharacterized protein YbjT (DUF2867 family)